MASITDSQVFSLGDLEAPSDGRVARPVDAASEHVAALVNPLSSVPQTPVPEAIDPAEDPTERMLELARARFHIHSFRPGQALAIRNVLGGIDTLALMPTGGGKSLCYQLPALQLNGITLVVSPLIALMKDQYDKLAGLGVDVLRLDSTLTPRDEAAALRRLTDGRPCIAYVTPERLSDDKFRARLNGVRVALFVVDEAHCISQWGHDFRPAYLGLGEAVRALGRPPVLALTATAPPRVKADILAQLGIEDAAVVDVGLSRPNLRYHVFWARSEARKQQLLLELLSQQEGNGIVYAATVKTVDALADLLRSRGIAAGRYHGRMRAREREAVQTSFMEHGEPRVMVATNAFGLGVDKQDTRFVVHYNFPGSLESYYQEAGRAGRDGKSANCVLLYQNEDKRIQSFFLGGRYPTPEQTVAVAEALIRLYSDKPRAYGLKAIAEAADAPIKKARVVLSFLVEIGVVKERGSSFVPIGRKPPGIADLQRATERYEKKRAQDQARLDAMLRYAESHLCRTRLLLTYFGYAEDAAEPCGNCDNCQASRKATSQKRKEAALKAARAAKQRGDTTDRRALLEQAALRRRERSGRQRALKIERPKQTVSTSNGLGLGDVVRHAKFGEGEVVRIKGDTVGAYFPSVGEKLLKAQFLEKVS